MELADGARLQRRLQERVEALRNLVRPPVSMRV